ncbi:MAG: CoA ester lyase [Candidatus Cloacimonetes bacterium]|nr:CoA ester lyase [Candidatus Cloacimonadota bacterium]
MKDLLLRSMLFAPGNRSDLHRKAAATTADAIILDMEDSVLDKAKEAARSTIVNSVKSGIFGDKILVVRLNDLDSGHLLKDIIALTIKGITGFIYPKSYVLEDITFFDRFLTSVELDKGFTRGHFKMIPLIETAAAVLHAEEICQASPRIIAAVFGSEDFLADIRGFHDGTGRSMLYPRAQMVLAARAAGIIPIDAMHINLHDLEDLEEHLKVAKVLGFEGKLLLHPKEIELAHRYFSPTSAEVKQARKLVELTRQAAVDNMRVAFLDGCLVGPPMLISARNILKRAELIARKKKS